MRSGKREGAGRPSGARNLKSKLETAKIRSEMQQYLPVAFQALVDVAENGKSESARVSAAAEILNRAVGRAVPANESDDPLHEFVKVLFEDGEQAIRDEGLEKLLHVPLPGLLE